jgi:hypothetical protein
MGFVISYSLLAELNYLLSDCFLPLLQYKDPYYSLAPFLIRDTN